MTLRNRLTLWLNALLLVVVALVSALTLFTTINALRESARRQALGTASLLANAATMTIGAPQEIERLIGDQMLVQARMAAHLVAVAETRAHMSPKEINTILKDITRSTDLDEIWITGPDGVARLYATDTPVTELVRFSNDRNAKPQSSEFTSLLRDPTGRRFVVQRAQRRDLDPRFFKYVAVSGVDKSRIVQVGNEAEFVRRWTSRFAVNRMVQHVVDAGNLRAIFITDPLGRPAVCGSPGTGRDLFHVFYQGKLDLHAKRTIRTLKPTASFRGNAVEACVPLPAFDGQVGTLICRMATRELDRATNAALHDVAMLSIGALLAGAAVANVLAKRISRPVKSLAEATRHIGSGGFGYRVAVESNDEVGLLAASFNKMADSLETYTGELAQSHAERESLRREMDIAAEIQRSLLPAACPRLSRFDIAADSRPAHEVGGDFFDFIELPGGRLGIVCADASGKGVPAALMMALSRSLIRAYSQDRPSALDAMQLANGFLCREMRSEMFVTCFYAVLDPGTNTLSYVNAGHNPPIIRRMDGETVLLRASGTPLGVIEEMEFLEETCPLVPGDVVLMYTDGMTEAQDAYGEQFGPERLQDLVRRTLHLPAGKIARRAVTAVETFSRGQPQFDDMTLVVLKVTSAE
jgi:sigma-B regulation protein RsbU (phosphoserine phosphatase)